MSITIPELSTWIDGTPTASAVVVEDHLHDPNTGEALQQSRSSSLEQVEQALVAASSAHRSGAWQNLGLEGRGSRLRHLADLVDARQDEIAQLDSLNSGVTMRETALFAGSLGDTIRTAVQIAEDLGESSPLGASQGPVVLRRRPWGPTALIAPWNAPSAVAVKKMAYALVSGAPVVLKPSPASPWSAELLAAAAAEVDLPAGVFSLVLGGGEVGQQICSDPRIKAISMTGSTATGRLIARASAPNLTRLRLELGSNNPAIVMADAAVADVVDDLATGMIKLNGQWCEAPRRAFVHESVFSDVQEALVDRMSRIRVGSSFDEDSELGPMAFEQRRDDLDSQRRRVAVRGARVDAGAEIPEDGWFFAPTVASATSVELPGEVFGPMIALEPYSSLDDAIAQANSGPHGLTGYVFSSDVDRAVAVGARLEAGEVKVNGTSLLDMADLSAQSFFGDSGLGGHGDVDVLDFYSGKQVVGVDLIDPPM
ncbi:aldehyde dehydrogenase family protein [Aeromicrobium endophyticum]|uniref:Aldehyde dehydrogenase family protein n=1 Tax=Aeromicrobium endophyticum TaxID=2292704 RepID=A0A371NYW1_9ACTN|nr:aldehyde dehydrogenase family protein [Aeromicrobium endophyticum]REK68884.1 aldehyde dehydrogenase family protein [Aeromicrobium endophyticum]